MNTSVPATSIDRSDLLRDNYVLSSEALAQEAQHEANSFENILNDAQQKLASIIFSNFSNFESVFSASPIEPNLYEIEEQFVEHREDVANTFPERSPGPEIIEKELNLSFIENDIDIIKEVLLNNIPLPYAGDLPLLMADMFQSGGISRPDMQILIDELISKAEFIKSAGKSQLTLTLSEKNLGELLISLTSQQGALAIEIAASPQTKKLLDDSLKELELALQRANVNISQIKIVEVKKENGQHA
ncbi:MAG: flagellar hook-length control protein FliK [Candidatus Margulisbacteria bacterium]|nr:flagellar hook-length control protein FliK [Candidatus Margulisiibacteriota bacterium]